MSSAWSKLNGPGADWFAVGSEFGVIPRRQRGLDQLCVSAEAGLTRSIGGPPGHGMFHSLHREAEDAIGGGIAERVHWLFAFAHALHLFLEHLAEKNYATIAG